MTEKGRTEERAAKKVKRNRKVEERGLPAAPQKSKKAVSPGTEEWQRRAPVRMQELDLHPLQVRISCCM